MDSFARDTEACQQILRRGSKSFHAASLLLPARLRGEVAALYAFCRVSDDAVDRSTAGGRAVERLSRRLDGIYAGRPEEHPIDRSLAEVVRRRSLPRALPDALLEGFAWDEEGRRYETLSELRAYSARVASTVGVMMTILMGERRPEVLARACDLGVAMQLTNIARDVGEDARDGRLYLPLEWLRERQIDPEAWREAPIFRREIGAAVAGLLEEADRLYARADAGVEELPADCRLAISMARMTYADIGRKIRHASYDSVRSRAMTSKARKLVLFGKAAAMGAARKAHVVRARGLGLWEPALPEVQFLIDAAVRAHAA